MEKKQEAKITKENMKKVTIEIEDYGGNTLMAFEINEKLEITKLKDCDVADIDGDYIFKTDNDLIRIQASKW